MACKRFVLARRVPRAARRLAGRGEGLTTRRLEVKVVGLSFGGGMRNTLDVLFYHTHSMYPTYDARCLQILHMRK